MPRPAETQDGERGGLERVVVIGTSSSGKSTFAARCSRATGHPHIELDAHFWGPGWRPRTPAEFHGRVQAEAAAPCWVADGNYRAVRELLWPRATAIVWLDYPLTTVLWRALRRTARRVWTREALWSGNRESFRRSFLSKDSILLWVWNTHRQRRQEFAALRAEGTYGQVRWVHCRAPAEAEQFLRAVEADSLQNGATPGGLHR